MASGTIKKLVADKGFGFIAPTGGGSDVFFHVSSVQGAHFDSLQVGQTVQFEIEDGASRGKGPRAASVSAS